MKMTEPPYPSKPHEDPFLTQTMVIRKWVNGGTVSTERLAAELEYWSAFYCQVVDLERELRELREISSDGVQDAEGSG